MALTKLQEEAFAKYKTLRPVKIDKEKIIENYYTPAYVHSGQIRCVRCGGECGPVKKYAIEERTNAYNSHYKPKPKARCPHCGHKFTTVTNHWYNAWIGYFAQYQKCGEWQVIRMNFVQMMVQGRRQKPVFKIVPDNYQIWYHPSGTRVTISHETGFMPNRKYNPLSEWSEMRVRTDNTSPYVNYDIDEHQVISMTPWFKELILSSLMKKHILDDAHAIDESVKLIYKMKQHPYFETLIKQGRQDLASQISLADMKKYKAQIRIAIFKHNLQIEKWDYYKDILRFMKELNMDMHSPKYLCPTDISEWHQELWRRIDLRNKAKELERKMADLIKAQPEYEKYHKRFFCIFIPAKDFIIRPIYSTTEMYEEGQHMHHCVGSYYQYKDSLILVARTHDNQRIATIEINTKEQKIIQIRGVQNSKPKEYDKIYQLLSSRLNDIVHPAKYKFKQKTAA